MESNEMMEIRIIVMAEVVLEQLRMGIYVLELLQYDIYEEMV